MFKVKWSFLVFLVAFASAFTGQVGAMGLFVGPDEVEREWPETIEALFDNGQYDDQDTLVLDRAVYETMPTLKEMISGPGALKEDGTSNNQITFKPNSVVTPQALAEVAHLTKFIQRFGYEEGYEMQAVRNNEQLIEKYLERFQPHVSKPRALKLIGQMAQTAHFLDAQVECSELSPLLAKKCKETILKDFSNDYSDLIDELGESMVLGLQKNDLINRYKVPMHNILRAQVYDLVDGPHGPLKIPTKGSYTQSVIVSPDGSFLLKAVPVSLTASSHVLDAQTGRELFSIKNGGSGVFTLNSNYLLVRSLNASKIISRQQSPYFTGLEHVTTRTIGESCVKIFDMKTKKEIGLIKLSDEDSEMNFSVAVNEKFLIGRDDKFNIKLWDMRQKDSPGLSFKGSYGLINNDGSLLFLNIEQDVDHVNKVEVYATSIMQKVNEIDGIIIKTNFHADYFIVKSNDGTLFLYDAKTCSVKAPLQGNRPQFDFDFYRRLLHPLMFSNDGKFLCNSYPVGMQDPRVELWNTHTGQLIRNIEGGAPLLSNDGKFIAVSNGGQGQEHTKVFMCETGQEVLQVNGHDVNFSDDGRFFISTNADGSIEIINTNSWQVADRLWGSGEFIPIKSKRFLVFLNKNYHRVTIWDSYTEKVVRFLNFGDDINTLEKFIFNTDATLMGAVHMVRSGSGKTLRRICLFWTNTWEKIDEYNGESFELTPDGSLLVVNDDQFVELWQTPVVGKKLLNNYSKFDLYRLMHAKKIGARYPWVSFKENKERWIVDSEIFEKPAPVVKPIDVIPVQSIQVNAVASVQEPTQKPEQTCVVKAVSREEKDSIEELFDESAQVGCVIS